MIDSGQHLERFDGKGYIRLDRNKIPNRAQEFAAWLDKTPIKGIGPAEIITGRDFIDKIDGRKGIIYFEDYWVRSNGQRSGDHIDLWNGSRMTDLSSWARVRGIHLDGYWSDYRKSKVIKFYPIEE